jgi:hypothetical protein
METEPQPDAEPADPPSGVEEQPAPSEDSSAARESIPATQPATLDPDEVLSLLGGQALFVLVVACTMAGGLLLARRGLTSYAGLLLGLLATGCVCSLGPCAVLRLRPTRLPLVPVAGLLSLLLGALVLLLSYVPGGQWLVFLAALGSLVVVTPQALRGAPPLSLVGGGLLALGAGAVLCVMFLGVSQPSPFLPEELPAGLAKSDTLLHLSLASSLQQFGVASTAVDGLLPFGYAAGPITIPYHVGSHFVLGRLSLLLGAELAPVYPLAQGALLLPLLLHAASLLAANGAAGATRAAARPTLILAGVLVFSCQDWTSYLESESYTFGLVLLLWIAPLLLSVALDAWPRDRVAWAWVALLLMIPVLYLGKTSVGVLWAGALAYLALRNLGLGAPLLASLGALATGALVVLYLTSSQGQSPGHDPSQHARFFVFYFKYPYPRGHLLYYLSHNGFTLAYVLFGLWSQGLTTLSAIREATTTRRLLHVELLVAIALAGNLPGLFTDFGAGSAVYFSNVQMWLALPLLAGALCGPGARRHLALSPGAAAIGLVLLLPALRMIPAYLLEQGRASARRRAELPTSPGPGDRILEHLRALRTEHGAELIVYVPHDNRTVWDLYAGCQDKTQFVPGAAGLPTLRGVTPLTADCGHTALLSHTYGVRDPVVPDRELSERELRELGAEKGFRLIYVYRSVDDPAQNDLLQLP